MGRFRGGFSGYERNKLFVNPGQGVLSFNSQTSPKWPRMRTGGPLPPSIWMGMADWISRFKASMASRCIGTKSMTPAISSSWFWCLRAR